MVRAFSREGANLFLAGRTLSSLERIASAVSKESRAVDVAKVDALSPVSVEDHVRKVVEKSGKLDVSFNIISADVGMGMPLTQLSADEFSNFAFTLARSNFITATAAARQMERQGSGVILCLTPWNARTPVAMTGGFSVAGAAIEAFSRQLALEVGPKNVRVVCLRTGATPDNPVLQEVFAELARVGGTTKEAIEKEQSQDTAFKRLPLLTEVANTAVLLASDYASAITATAVNASCGQIVD